ncbi:hypothetical protein ACFX2I_036182 [Malus domestica]
MSAPQKVKVVPGMSLKVDLVCSPRPKKEDLFWGREEESWMYWSLKTRKVLEFDGSGEVSKTTSLVDRRVTVKPNGVVLRRVKTRSLSGGGVVEFRV